MSAETMWFKGWADACKDFGIWKSGTQVIGCMETPVRELIDRKGAKMNLCAKAPGCEAAYGSTCSLCRELRPMESI